MNTELTKKIIRCFIVGLIFLSMLTIMGMGNREAQQFAFMLVVMALFGLLLRNIWLMLFLFWTVFLYCFFKFETGSVYLANVFYGCILYYLAKISFEKKHINFFINGVIWFAVANTLYVIIQYYGFDFIYFTKHLDTDLGVVNNYRLTGFMGDRSFMGILMALCVPLVATRRWKWAKIACFLLFIPLWYSRASIAILMAIIGLLFVFWFRIKRWIWVVLVILLISLGGLYITKVDNFSLSRLGLWKASLKNAVQHPVTGWGLDSYRNITKNKDFKYMAKSEPRHGNLYIRWWDNPHNLYISIFFEWGIIGIFILAGYLRQLFLWFRKAEKNDNTIALFSFALVLLGISGAHFPMFLSRFCVIAIPMFALLEIQMRRKVG